MWASPGSASKLALEYLTIAEGVAFRIIGAAVVLWFTGFVLLRRNFRLTSPRPLIMGSLAGAARYCRAELWRCTMSHTF